MLSKYIIKNKFRYKTFLLSSKIAQIRNFSAQIRPRRALLYMPANNLKMVNKATKLDVDTMCMDLEDAITYNLKEAARPFVVEALEKLNFGRTEVMFRINPVGSIFAENDLYEVLKAKILPHGIVIPKVQHVEDIRYVDEKITEITGNKGNEIKLLALIESAKGLVNLKEICSFNEKNKIPRLEGLIFGADDYAADIGAVRSKENWEVSFARNLVLLYAKAANLQAIDVVNINYKDEAGLIEESRVGFNLGYTGKQIIHPNQIDPVQKCFSPSKENIEYAKRVIDAYKHNKMLGKGAFSLDGQMIDMPTIKNSQAVLDRAEACDIAI